ncbi:MAG: ABC transporter substrate-binding protein [Betaproteobacteria bacterium]|nr:MAG: ABC transporter substrate-binding protein [Betaproteobacteria bacterium]
MRSAFRSLLASAVIGAFAAFLITPQPAAAQQKVKIGFISTFSGPQGVMGQYMKESVELAIEHLGGKVGGLPVEMFYGDDQVKPDVGVQVAEEMLKKHQVDFMSGIIWSNVMMAVVPVVTGSGHIMVGSNAGASPLAGSQCNELYFSTSWNNDQTPEAMGKFLQDSGVNDIYVIAPNYQAGKDMVTGLKRYYKGNIVEELYTKLGQQDYQAEITQLRSKNPKAVFAFLPGGMGIQFLKQYDQAGLRGQLPLYTVYTVDEISIPAVKDAALGIYETRYWSPDLKNPANNRFVADYKKKYGKLPVFYGAQAYDSILLIDSAVRAVKGDLKDVKGMVAAMRKANFNSLRGPFQYNVNHHPIQNFYLLKTEKTQSGDIEMHIQKTIFEKHKDSYYQDCKMKW